MRKSVILIVALAVSVSGCAKPTDPIPENLAMMTDEISNVTLAAKAAVDSSDDVVPIDRLQEAFHAAFLNSKNAGTDQELVPEKLFWLAWGPVLVSRSSDIVAPQFQKVTIHYLRFTKGKFTVDKSFLDSGSGGLNPVITKKFSKFPVMYSEGLSVGGGVTQSFFELTELRPDGPHILGTFVDSEDNGDGKDHKSAKFGLINNSGFELVCPTALQNRTIRYRRVGDAYVSDNADGGSGCAQ